MAPRLNKSQIEAALDELLSGKVRTTPGYGGRPPVIGSRTYTHPLQTMLARNVIGFSVYHGGNRFRSDYEAAFIKGTATTNWERPVARKALPYSSKQASAVEADTIRRIAAMLGSIDFKIVVAVCVQGHTMEQIATAAHIARATVEEARHLRAPARDGLLRAEGRTKV